MTGAVAGRLALYSREVPAFCISRPRPDMVLQEERRRAPRAAKMRMVGFMVTGLVGSSEGENISL